MKKSLIKANLDKLHLSDIYTLMMFILFKVEEVPEYATLSRLCFLLDGNNLTRLLAYFAGQTIKIPTEEEFKELTNALLLYQYINLEGQSLVDAQRQLNVKDDKEKEKILDLYLKIIPIIKEYNIDEESLKNHGR